MSHKIDPIHSAISALSPQERQALTGVKGWLRLLCAVLIFEGMYQIGIALWSPSGINTTFAMIGMFSMTCGLRLAVGDKNGIVLTRLYVVINLVVIGIILAFATYLYVSDSQNYRLDPQQAKFAVLALIALTVALVILFYLKKSRRVRLTYPAAFEPNLGREIQSVEAEQVND